MSGVVLRGGMAYDFGGGNRAGITLNYDYLDYSFSSASAFGSVGPWNIVHRYGMTVPLAFAGLALSADTRDSGWARLKRAFGRGILYSAPYLMKFLSIAGTAAMFLVGGGILVHSIPALHHVIQPYAEGELGWLWGSLFNAGVGVLTGAVVVAVVTAVSRLRGKRHGA